MNIREIFRVSLQAIRANKLRSFLTALGVIIGVAAVILLISIGSGLQNYITRQFEGMGTNSLFIIPGKMEFSGAGTQSINKLTFNLIDKLDKGKGRYITDISPFIEINITASYRNKSKVTRLLGTKSSYFQGFNIRAEKGRLFNEIDNKRARKVAVIGQTLAKDLYGVQNPIGKSISLSNKLFTIIGVLEKEGNVAGVDVDNQVAIPVQSGRILTGADQVNSVLVRVESLSAIPLARKQLERILLRTLSEDDFSILSQEQLLTSVLQIIGVLTLALGGIAAISLIVGGVGISNIMLVSVTERTREIGLRKAVGATPRDILYQFLTEAVILSLFGGLVGVIIGYAGSLVLSIYLQTAVPLWSVLLGLGFSTFVGIVFGVAPAIRASRLQPIEALRHE